MSTRQRWSGLWAVPAAIAVALFLLPLAAIVLRAPWGRLFEQLADADVHDAMRLSLVSSVGATVLATVLGLPLAVWLAGGRSALRTAARIVVMLPVVLPPVVGGVALLLAFGRNGIVGAVLDRWFGLSLPFTTAGAVAAATYMGMPFFVLSAEAGLRSFDRRFLEAAATLGAGRWRRFRLVVLPMVRPSLRTGMLLCWARALGEFCATQTFAGNLAGTTRTMPLACALAMETEPDLAIVLSLLLATASVVVLFLLRRTWFPSR
ncbi:MAG TPA: ABC transporter permease subunit [Planctomycetota bacterium]|nr:ABC transporter permease subunit [Planctomycetota bacterium]